jgi:hypothetical protein
MAKSIQASEKDFPEALKNARLINEEVKSQTQRAPELSLSRLLLPSMENNFQKFASHHAQLRCAQTALAVQIFRVQNQGKPPTNLDQLKLAALNGLPIDPFTGTTLRYRPMAEGFLVYSLGPDEKDDGGMAPENSSGKDRIAGILAEGNQAQTNRLGDIPFTVWR